MFRVIFAFVFLSFLLGCRTIPQKETSPKESSSRSQELPAPAESPAEVGPEEVPVVPQGIIFAKTQFEGVVKKSYIRLTIVDQQDNSKVYHLYIGDKSRQLDFPWESETIQPGYFYIPLPAGSYAIASLSIPVGSSLATELMDIAFEVEPDKTVYLGTLQVFGTKEKIKLGGIPIIKPGFEYTVNILDEHQEALQEFKQRFPENSPGLDIRLMKDLTQEKWSKKGAESRKLQKKL